MKSEKALVGNTLVLSGLQVKATLVALVATMALPFLIHLIPPVDGTPMGAMLLPMFYAPFVAIIFFRYHVGLIAGVLAPVLNFLLTGRPEWQLMTVLSLELALFVTIAWFVLKSNSLFSWVAAPLAYLGAKVISSSLLFVAPILVAGRAPIDFLLGSVTTAAAGIFALALINVVALKMKK